VTAAKERTAHRARLQTEIDELLRVKSRMERVGLRTDAHWLDELLRARRTNLAALNERHSETHADHVCWGILYAMYEHAQRARTAAQ
jgi:hypothetical protein